MLVRGLNALAAVVSTPLAAPVIAATRLRGGTANSARGAASLGHRGDQRGPAGRVLWPVSGPDRLRLPFRRAPRRHPLRRGIFLRHRAPAPRRPRRDRGHPRGRLDPHHLPAGDLGREPATADLRRPGRGSALHRVREEKEGQAITARLIVRRVRDLNPKASQGQDELFTSWRYHAVFTDSPFEMIQAEAQHRDHAIIEQVFADWNDGPLAHLPSGHFPANAAWLTLAAITANLTRAAGALASPFHARARSATIRAGLITVAARIARHGRGHITLHLPEGWHRETGWLNLFEAACGPPATTAA